MADGFFAAVVRQTDTRLLSAKKSPKQHELPNPTAACMCNFVDFVKSTIPSDAKNDDIMFKNEISSTRF
jgi:hypothetical protein